VRNCRIAVNAHKHAQRDRAPPSLSKPRTSAFEEEDDKDTPGGQKKDKAGGDGCFKCGQVSQPYPNPHEPSRTARSPHTCGCMRPDCRLACTQ